MTHLQTAAADYVTIRRNMGFKSEDNAKLLANFVEQLEARGSYVITSTTALSWAHAAGRLSGSS